MDRESTPCYEPCVPNTLAGNGSMHQQVSFSPIQGEDQVGNLSWAASAYRVSMGGFMFEQSRKTEPVLCPLARVSACATRVSHARSVADRHLGPQSVRVHSWVRFS